MSENRKHAIEFSTKLDFYFIALVFTVLGLSIQTGELARPFGQFIVEIAAWVSLLASGLAGLSRMEWTPVAYIHTDERKSAEETLSKLEQARGNVVAQGDLRRLSPEELTQIKDNLRGRIDFHKEKFTAIERRGGWKYHVYKWGFVVGLVLLITSRAMLGLSSFTQMEPRQIAEPEVRQVSPEAAPSAPPGEPST